MRFFGNPESPPLGGGVRDLYSRDGLKGNAVKAGSDPSPWQRTPGIGISDAC